MDNRFANTLYDLKRTWIKSKGITENSLIQMFKTHLDVSSGLPSNSLNEAFSNVLRDYPDDTTLGKYKAHLSSIVGAEGSLYDLESQFYADTNNSFPNEF